MHDYGLEKLASYLTSGNYFWDEKPYKKVMLVNVDECENKITLYGMADKVTDLGHFEWQARQAGWLVKAVEEAIKSGKKEADITEMFSCEMYAFDSCGEYRISQERVNEVLMTLFSVVNVTEDQIDLKLVEIA